MKVGIFGCTADPFTCAHYEIVNRVLKERLVDKVIVIPTVVNYYRIGKSVLFSIDERKEVISKWFENRDDIIFDWHEYEIADDILKNHNDINDMNRRKFWHTLLDVMSRYDNINSSDFYTIIGGDSWNSLECWFNWKELGLMTKFIVVKRDSQLLKDYSMHEEYRLQPYHVLELDKKFNSVSATDIRSRLLKMNDGMSIGACATPFNLYIDEIDDYLKTGKTYEDRLEEYRSALNVLETSV